MQFIELPAEIRNLLMTEWELDRAYEETTKKLNAIRDEAKAHRNKIKNLPPEKQAIYWKAMSQHYKEIFSD
jgi:uncharacterized coiled-coil DUF342 family protein